MFQTEVFSCTNTLSKCLVFTELLIKPHHRHTLQVDEEMKQEQQRRVAEGNKQIMQEQLVHEVNPSPLPLSPLPFFDISSSYPANLVQTCICTPHMHTHSHVHIPRAHTHSHMHIPHAHTHSHMHTPHCTHTHSHMHPPHGTHTHSHMYIPPTYTDGEA